MKTRPNRRFRFAFKRSGPSFSGRIREICPKDVSSLCRGMTLLEILVALGLMSLILGFVWGMVTLFSNNYLSSERRIGRAQLVRSISQMLSDDLEAAVQDPIHPLQNVGNDQTVFVRRFGLRGDATSLQIDVVEPNLLVETASVADNRAAAATSSKPTRPQVPELKTVFYEFVPINALQDRRGDSSFGGDGGGSTTIGSLQTPTSNDVAPPGADVPGGTPFKTTDDFGGADRANADPFGGDDRSRLVRKFGLSRRELSYEAPDPTMADQNDKADSALASGPGGYGVIGSLTTESNSFFPDSESENDSLLSGVESSAFQNEPFLTAPQIAMEIDDGTVWIPEVVDCRFRYFDGNRWFASWDSIQRGGLPTAIEIGLKLIPLDDAEEIRSSPDLFRISYSRNNPFFGSERDANGVVGSLNATGNSFGRRSESNSLTIEEAVDRLGLSAVMTRSVVTYIPTTPLARHQALGRRKPLSAASGRVDSSPNNGPGSRRVSSGGLEGGRTFQSREAAFPDPENNRRHADRTFGDREAIVRNGNGPGRTIPERLAVERPQTTRDNDENLSFADAFSLTPNSVRNDPSFDGIDSLLSGFNPTSSEDGYSGMIPTAEGISVPTQTTSPADRNPGKKTGTQQTWIRGKR